MIRIAEMDFTRLFIFFLLIKATDCSLLGEMSIYTKWVPYVPGILLRNVVSSIWIIHTIAHNIIKHNVMILI